MGADGFCAIFQAQLQNINIQYKCWLKTCVIPLGSEYLDANRGLHGDMHLLNLSTFMIVTMMFIYKLFMRRRKSLVDREL